MKGKIAMMNAVRNIFTVSLTIIFASAAGKICWDISKDVYSGISSVWSKMTVSWKNVSLRKGLFSVSKPLGK